MKKCGFETDLTLVDIGLTDSDMVQLPPVRIMRTHNINPTNEIENICSLF